MIENKVPPYSRKPPMYPGSPWNRRCDEIDKAAESDADVFIQIAAAHKQIDAAHLSAIFQAPSKRQIAEGVCSLYSGHINCGGADSAMLCNACDKQLHVYVETKLCEQGRYIYCPIWKSKL